MKKIILLITFTFIILNTNAIYCSQTEEVIKEQEQELGIAGFIKQAQDYAKEGFEDVDIGSLYKDALTGQINAEGITKRNI